MAMSTINHIVTKQFHFGLTLFVIPRLRQKRSSQYTLLTLQMLQKVTISDHSGYGLSQ